MKHILFYINFIFIFNACTYTTYKHINPTTFSGMQCVNDCQGVEYNCRKKRDKENNYYKKQYERNYKVYKICKKSNNVKNQKKLYEKKRDKYLKQCMLYNNIKSCKVQYGNFTLSKQKCHKPTRTYVDDECLYQYESCFKGCGGEIIEIEKDLF